MFRAAREQRADIEWAGSNDVIGVESVAQLLTTDSVCGAAKAIGLVVPELDRPASAR